MVRKMPSGQWAARIRDPKLRKQVWLGTFATKELAELEEAQAKLDMRLMRGGDETCDSFARRWMDDYPEGRTESTRDHNRGLIEAFARDFEGRKLRNVTRAEARLWAMGGTAAPHLRDVAARWRDVEVAGRSVEVEGHRSHAKVARAMFSDAINEGLADRNPFANMRVGDGPGRKNIVPLREGEVLKLAEIAGEVHGADGSGKVTGDYGRLLYAPLVLVAAYTGMRPGELYALRWDDVEGRRVHVRRQLSSRLGRETPTKNKKQRVIALPARAAEALEVVREGGDRGPLFNGDPIFRIRNGKPFVQRMSHYYWDPVRAAFRAWLAEHDPARHETLLTEFREGRRGRVKRKMDFYELRHFCASMMLARGARPQVIAHQLGHTDGGRLVQSTYGHLYEDEALAEIDAVWDEPRGRRRVG